MATPLLNDDGSASMATLIMCSHHAFRRDIACFAEGVAAIAAGDESRVGAVRDEWKRFQAALHGHHTSEDNGIFPTLRAEHPELASAIDELDAHHRAIDPLLARGYEVFADLPRQARAACEVIGALAELLALHLDTEERTVIPYLRDAKQFPAPASGCSTAISNTCSRAVPVARSSTGGGRRIAVSRTIAGPMDLPAIRLRFTSATSKTCGLSTRRARYSIGGGRRTRTASSTTRGAPASRVGPA
jgi:hemerythrin-like domain-containing protein